MDGKVSMSYCRQPIMFEKSDRGFYVQIWLRAKNIIGGITFYLYLKTEDLSATYLEILAGESFEAM